MDRKAHPESSHKEESRAPKRSDLSSVCGELNRLGAKYVVVGGFAMLEAGFLRLNANIDLLVDPSPENEALVFKGLRILPGKIAAQLHEGDLGRHAIVRVVDDVIVDLATKICGVEYGMAIKDAVYRPVEGVPIPFASPRMLLKMRQTGHAKDAADRMFLERLIDATSGKTKNDETGVVASLRWWVKKNEKK